MNKSSNNVILCIIVHQETGEMQMIFAKTGLGPVRKSAAKSGFARRYADVKKNYISQIFFRILCKK
jgi:hypothetical protein